MASKIPRRVYTRDEILACKEAAANIIFPINSVPIRPPRVNRKKSQSNETETYHLHDDSIENLNLDDADQSNHHHRNHRVQWNVNQQHSAHFATSHVKQHGEAVQTAVSTTLRPTQADVRRGGHGDWSRGCAGWRQRSYSGSERSGAVFGHPGSYPNHRGKGTGTAGHFGVDGEEVSTRGRSRGRVNNRHSHSHRGVFGRNYHVANAYRPTSYVGNVIPINDTEEFWQDEDWTSMELEHEIQVARKPQSCVSKCCEEAPPTDSVPHLDKCGTKARVYSKSCSVEPPPGFELPPKPFTDEMMSDTSDPFISSSTNNEDKSNLIKVANSNTSSRWYYIDSFWRKQGPFDNQQMAMWLASGYLPLSIEIRRECDECFLPLVDHMNMAGRIPFWNGYSQPPITQLNLPSVAVSALRPMSTPRWVGQIAPEMQELIASSSSLPPQVLPVSSAISHIPPMHELHGTVSASNNAISTTSAASGIILANAAGLSIQKQPVFSGPSNDNCSASGIVLPTFLVCDQVCLPMKLNDNPEVSNLCNITNEALIKRPINNGAEKQDLVDRFAVANISSDNTLTSKFITPSYSTGESNSVLFKKRIDISVYEHAQPIFDNSLVNAEGTITTASGDFSSGPADVQSVNIGREVASKVTTGRTVSTSVSGEDSFEPIQEPTFADNLSGKSPTNDPVKKNKKKNKKNKKVKTNPEKERQLAWDAEFERRKAAALDRKLSEEAEALRLVAEENAALQEEQAAILQEQRRLLLEQRKREMQRVKEDSQLVQLRLPQSARWAASARIDSDAPVPTVPGGHPNPVQSITSIQAAQRIEELEERKNGTHSLEHIVTSVTPDAPVSVKPYTPAWTSSIHSDCRAAPKQFTASKITGSKLFTPTKLDITHSKSTVQIERSKPVALSTPPSNSKSPTSVSPFPTVPSATVPSIWDLSTGGVTSTVSTNKTQKKNKKKNAHITREDVSFAAKEQLAHWCESQLSSMPLSGVDLPTLVDLLCELEAADQVVEFIETSLGRSKRTSKFSKAFLEKRACILNTVH